jgi:hypothetical protein
LPIPQPADTAASQLATGDQGASITALAAAWRTAASTIDGYHQTITTAADNLKTQWSGDAADAALDRLTPYASWFSDAAAAHRAAALAADQVLAAHNRALTEHPTVEQLTALKQQLANATARAQTGNPAAAAEAEGYRQQLIEAQTRSATVTASYASAAAVPAATIVAPPSPVNPGAHAPAQPPGKPGNEVPQPRPGDTADGPTLEKPPKDDGSLAKTLDGDGAKKLTDQTQMPSTPSPLAPADPPPKGPTPTSLDEPLADPAKAPAMPAVMPMMAPLMQGLSQAAQSAPQMPSGQSMPSMPQMPTTPPQMPTPPSSPMTPTSPESPINPAALGSGGAPAGGGGGSGGIPAAAAPTGLNAAAPVSSTPPPPAAPAGPAAGIGAGMPMGMMPHGAGKQGSEKQRPTDLAPDEPVYIEDRPHTEALIGGNIGPEPPPEIKEGATSG